MLKRESRTLSMEKSPVGQHRVAAGKEKHGKRKNSVLHNKVWIRVGKMDGTVSACHEWNSFVEETVEKKSARGSRSADSSREAKAVPLSQIEMTQEQRVSTGMKELDRVLGGGIVQGSLVLVGGIRESENRRCFCRYAGILRNIKVKVLLYFQ